MPAVIFQVSGEHFCPETALSQVTFQPYRVHRKGELMKIRRKESVYKDSGFSVDLGPEDSDDLAVQIELAQAFVDHHFDELKQIKGADDMRFDFGYEPRRRKDGSFFAVQYDYFPPAFLRTCSEVGIGINLSLHLAMEPKPADEPTSSASQTRP